VGSLRIRRESGNVAQAEATLLEMSDVELLELLGGAIVNE